MGTRSNTDRLRELSLFSGAGGGLLGSLLLGWRTVCCVEWNDYCQRVLAQRMQDGWLDECPIWDDVRTFDGRPWRGHVDVLTAGFPCQAFSSAGDNTAVNMWPDTARVISEVRPPIAFLENVAGLLSKSHGYFGRVLGDLSEMGYDATWATIPASAAGAPHKRDRLWILACDSDQDSQSKLTKHAQAPRMREISRPLRSWPDPPTSLSVDDGVAHRMDRLAALGNGQVPQQMALAWSLLSRRMARALD